MQRLSDSRWQDAAPQRPCSGSQLYGGRGSAGLLLEIGKIGVPLALNSLDRANVPFERGQAAAVRNQAAQTRPVSAVLVVQKEVREAPPMQIVEIARSIANRTSKRFCRTVSHRWTLALY